MLALGLLTLLGFGLARLGLRRFPVLLLAVLRFALLLALGRFALLRLGLLAGLGQLGELVLAAEVLVHLFDQIGHLTLALELTQEFDGAVETAVELLLVGEGVLHLPLDLVRRELLHGLFHGLEVGLQRLVVLQGLHQLLDGLHLLGQFEAAGVVALELLELLLHVADRTLQLLAQGLLPLEGLADLLLLVPVGLGVLHQLAVEPFEVLAHVLALREQVLQLAALALALLAVEIEDLGNGGQTQAPGTAAGDLTALEVVVVGGLERVDHGIAGDQVEQSEVPNEVHGHVEGAAVDLEVEDLLGSARTVALHEQGHATPRGLEFVAVHEVETRQTDVVGGQAGDLHLQVALEREVLGGQRDAHARGLVGLGEKTVGGERLARQSFAVDEFDAEARVVGHQQLAVEAIAFDLQGVGAGLVETPRLAQWTAGVSFDLDPRALEHGEAAAGVLEFAGLTTGVGRRHQANRQVGDHRPFPHLDAVRRADRGALAESVAEGILDPGQTDARAPVGSGILGHGRELGGLLLPEVPGAVHLEHDVFVALDEVVHGQFEIAAHGHALVATHRVQPGGRLDRAQRRGIREYRRGPVNPLGRSEPDEDPQQEGDAGQHHVRAHAHQGNTGRQTCRLGHLRRATDDLVDEFRRGPPHDGIGASVRRELRRRLEQVGVVAVRLERPREPLEIRDPSQRTDHLEDDDPAHGEAEQGPQRPGGGLAQL